MQRRTRTVRGRRGPRVGCAIAVVAAVSCSDGTVECPSGCPAGFTCFYGECLPGGDAGFDVEIAPDVETDVAADGGDAGGDADADADAGAGDDAGADADGGADGDGDADADADGDAGGDADADGGADADGHADDGGCVPSPPEVCNGRDDDCDGVTDEGFPCLPGAAVGCTTTCGSAGVGFCRADCSLPAPAECAPPPETCNGVDDDCDRMCDDGWECCAGSSASCSTSCGTTGTASCSAACTPGECRPPAETCNGIDDDCDTICDNGRACCAGRTTACRTTCGSTGTQVCSAACTLPSTCTPPAEICGNLVDDDCDTAIDEGCGGSNDTCAGALNVSAGGTFTGSTAGYFHESLPPRACVPSDTDPPNLVPDAYFFFDLTVASDVFVHTDDTDFDTVLYVGTTCGGADLGCNDDVNPASSPGFYNKSAVAARALAPGRYWITLDGFYDSWDSGPYSLSVYITPTDVAGDRCGSPSYIAPGGAAAIGTTCAFSNEYEGSCGGRGAEGVYYFAVPTGGATPTISTCNGGSPVDAVLYLRSDCPTPSSAVACNDNDAGCLGAYPGAARLGPTLGPGIYFLFVDTARADPTLCGAYQVDITGL